MLRNYRFPILVLTGVGIGALIGLIAGPQAAVLEPLGQVFINLMFTLVVPLVFFSISSAVAAMDSPRRLGRILGTMMGIFVATGIVASVLMLAILALFQSSAPLSVSLEDPGALETPDPIGEQIVQAITVQNIGELLSPSHMLALIIFAVLVGIATSKIGAAGRPFAEFLRSASDVFMTIVSIVMWYAPIGLGAYFAALIGQLGPQLVGGYLRAFVIYFPVAVGYFLIGFTLYSFLAGGREGVRRFWRNMLEPTAIALGTGSSVAALPANLRAAQKNGVPRDVRETIIPIGATIHMEGSCLSAILKISFLFTLFERDLFTPTNLLIAIGIALLSGMVMSGIPSGGFVGELLIVTMYGFPPSALPVISIIGTIVDAPATAINAVGDNVSGMMVSRVIDGKDWMDKGDAEAAADAARASTLASSAAALAASASSSAAPASSAATPATTAAQAPETVTDTDDATH